MTYAFLAILGSFAFFMVYAQMSRDAERKQWAEERRELLNRIQAPSFIPTAPQYQFEAPEREPDEYARVGSIVIDPDYGLDDDGAS
jgi:hypothetical protein